MRSHSLSLRSGGLGEPAGDGWAEVAGLMMVTKSLKDTEGRRCGGFVPIKLQCNGILVEYCRTFLGSPHLVLTFS